MSEPGLSEPFVGGADDRPESRFEKGTALLVLAIAGIAFFRPLWASAGDTVPGTEDALLNLFTLEQWYRWMFHSQGSWLGGGFFYPVANTLGLTDAMFLLALPYSLFRVTGLDLFTAYQATLYGSSLIACAAFYYFLRHDLRLRALPTSIGVVIAVFSNAMFLSMGHTQLFSYSLIPILCLIAFRLLDRLLRSSGGTLPYSLTTGVLVALFLFTGFYLAWFFVLFVALVFVIALAGRTPRHAAMRIASSGQGVKALTLMIAASAVGLIPFALAYLPAMKEIGGRPFSMVEQFLPRWFDLVNVSYDNLAWGWVFQRWFPVIYDSRVYSELFKGISPVAFALFAASAAVCLSIWVRDRRAASSSGWAVSLGTVVVLALLVCWMLMIRWPSGSAWKFVYEFVPGATAVRAVFRFNLMLAFAVGLVIAVGLTTAARLSIAKSEWCAGALAALMAVTGVFVSLEQINIGKVDHLSKQKLIQILEKVGPTPTDCRYFFVVAEPVSGSPRDRDGRDIRGNVLAMLAAQVAGIPTLNGHSSGAPDGWGLTWISRPDYLAQIAAWTRKKQTGDGLCSLDLSSGQWTAVGLGALPVAMTDELGEADFRFTGYLEPEPSTMRPGEQRQIDLLVKNLGTRPWTSLSDAPKKKYSVNLSYRWITKSDDSAGFDYRAPIPGVAKPGEMTRVPMLVTAPDGPGDYVLEIDAVQEWVAFFRHRGNPTIRVPVSVR